VGTPQLLVVEDDPDVRALMSAVLERAGYTVDCVDTLSRAEVRLAARMYDAVIVDAILPDGSALPKAVRWSASGFKTIIVTGFPQAMIDMEALGLRYLRKPFKVDEMIGEVERLLTGTSG
jgi:two-component system OmpR family response regulator